MNPTSNTRQLMRAALLCALAWSGQSVAARPIHPSNAEGLKRAKPVSGKAAYLPPPLPPCPGMIDNGVVRLGVAPEGHLNIPCTNSTVSSGSFGTDWVGLRYLPTNGEASAPGTPCEGWGVASADLGISGFTSAGCGAGNVTVEGFYVSPMSATSVVRVGNTFKVTHRYTPSPVSSFLYQVDVFIENIGTAFVADLRYTRGIDYDILPNTFSEYVTIAGATPPWVLGSVDNGFSSLNPLSTDFPLMGGVGNFTDLGPSDLGAHFDFQLGSLPAGEVRSFRTFYGAADTEGSALGALFSVGVGTYSLGQGDWNGTGNPLSSSGAPSGTFGAITGQPNTFMYGFMPPETPTRCTVECRATNPNELYNVDLMGTQDICLVNGSSYIIPVAVIYRNGQRIEFNCGDYGPPYGNLCNVVPGQDTCNASVYETLCNSPGYAQGCL